MKKTTLYLALGIVSCLLSVPAHATLLSTSGYTSTLGLLATGTSSNTVGNVSGSGSAVTSPFCSSTTPKVNGFGTVVADTCVITKNVYSGGSPTGTSVSFREVVYQEAITGTLDFYYQVAVSGSSARSLADVFALPFTNVNTWVGTASGVNLLASTPHSTSGSNDDPTKIVNGNLTGSSSNSLCHVASNDCITWDFVPTLASGGVTLTLVISTDATHFIKDQVGMDMSPNGVIDPITGYSAVAVPEPVSIVLLGTILAFSAFFIRRRRVAKAESSVS
jgi:hypothetical protein